jgi:hypothetical protein
MRSQAAQLAGSKAANWRQLVCVLSTHCNRALPVNRMWRLSSNAVHHGLQLPQQLVALLWCDRNGVQFEEHVVPVQLDASMTSHIICLCGGCVQQAPVAPIRMGCEEELQ